MRYERTRHNANTTDPEPRRAITTLHGNPDEPKTATEASTIISSLIAKARDDKYHWP